MLAGKQYTFISWNGGYNPVDAINVHTSQYLDHGRESKGPGTKENVTYDYSAEFKQGSITVCDSYGVWGINSSTDSWDTEGYKNPYLVFDHTRTGEQLKIVQLNGYGEILVWKICVEDTESLSDLLPKPKVEPKPTPIFEAKVEMKIPLIDLEPTADLNEIVASVRKKHRRR